MMQGDSESARMEIPYCETKRRALISHTEGSGFIAVASNLIRAWFFVRPSFFIGRHCTPGGESRRSTDSRPFICDANSGFGFARERLTLSSPDILRKRLLTIREWTNTERDGVGVNEPILKRHSVTLVTCSS